MRELSQNDTSYICNMELNKIYNMDCLEGMKQMQSDSVDCIVSDPPYGYSFMGKDWDKSVPSVDIWKECLRVLKSGAFAFVMSAPRLDVQSQMAIRLQEAGFRIDFTPIFWAYASGFPKSTNISKAVDKKLGFERNKIPATGNLHDSKISHEWSHTKSNGIMDSDDAISFEARSLSGSYAGFQPKPAVEVILVAMKPLSEKTFVNQALKNNHGITWLDDCRIPFQNENDLPNDVDGHESTIAQLPKYRADYQHDNNGRFPANLLVSDNVLDNGDISKSTKTQSIGGYGVCTFANNRDESENLKVNYVRGYDDEGQFSRYFSLDSWWKNRIKKLPDEIKETFPFLIVPKASTSEKEKNLESFEKKQWVNGSTENKPQNDSAVLRHNSHPTVKPIDLMSYLVSLGSREQEVILDPFMGSGTTAIASRILNRRFIGFELSKEYHTIAEARIKEHMAQKKLHEVFV